MEFSSLAGKKIAGIPVIYFALIVAAVALYGAFKMKNTDTSSGPTDAQATGAGDTPEGDLPDTSQPVFAATPVIYQPSGISVSSTPQEDSNALWAKRSVEWLIGNGFSVDIASNAITKYLDGDALSYQEGRARDAAIKQFGLPPEDVIATTAAGKPKPAPKPAPEPAPKPHKYYRSTSRTNTAAEIAAKNGISVATLHHLNPHMHFPVKPHTRVRVQ